MKSKSKYGINLLIALTGVFLFTCITIINSKHDHSGWGGFMFFIIGSIYSLILGFISTLIVLTKGKYWNSIIYLSSCLLNLSFMILVALGLVTHTIDKAFNTSFIFLLSGYSILGGIQLLILIRFIKMKPNPERVLNTFGVD